MKKEKDEGAQEAAAPKTKVKFRCGQTVAILEKAPTDWQTKSAQVINHEGDVVAVWKQATKLFDFVSVSRVYSSQEEAVKVAASLNKPAPAMPAV